MSPAFDSTCKVLLVKKDHGFGIRRDEVENHTMEAGVKLDRLDMLRAISAGTVGRYKPDIASLRC